jgi:hypothetical protein
MMNQKLIQKIKKELVLILKIKMNQKNKTIRKIQIIRVSYLNKF